MSKKGEQKVGQCTYCGKEKPLTDDHVPPKNLFPEPRPSNLITVPSCDDCNAPYAKDDEYFRTIISTLEVSESHDAAKKLWETKTSKSLSRSESIGFREMIRKSMIPVEHFSQGGIYLGKKTAYKIDLDRVNKVISRTIRGLFWRHTGNRLPNESDIVIFMDPDVNNINERAVDFLASLPETIIGDGIFSYRYHIFSDRPNASTWVLIFYESVPFICWTTPSEQEGQIQ